MEDTAKSSLTFDLTKLSNWTKDFIDEPLVASEFAVPYLQWWMPISAFGYFGALVVIGLIKKGILGPNFKIGSSLQFWHNMFLAGQSAGLIVVLAYLYMDTAVKTNLHPFSDISKILVAKERVSSRYFDFTMLCFLASKLYESIDTFILIINEKPLLALHVWHHATTYLAFYTGLFTGAGFWIGFLNSFIHVVMYMYYAKIPGMKAIAKYITSMQIIHLFGGTALNVYTLMFPISMKTSPVKYHDVSCQFFSGINCFLCFSYFLLFLAFFSVKYNKKGSAKASFWSFVGVPLCIQKVMYTVQNTIIPSGIINYLLDQGLAVPEAVTVAKTNKKEH